MHIRRRTRDGVRVRHARLLEQQPDGHLQRRRLARERRHIHRDVRGVLRPARSREQGHGDRPGARRVARGGREVGEDAEGEAREAHRVRDERRAAGLRAAARRLGPLPRRRRGPTQERRREIQRPALFLKGASARGLPVRMTERDRNSARVSRGRRVPDRNRRARRSIGESAVLTEVPKVLHCVRRRRRRRIQPTPPYNL
jgi:hypothetical protein